MMRYLLLAALFGALQGCAPLPADNRSGGTSFQDQHIENEAITRINLRHNGSVHVNVTSFNRHVLLTGEVPTEADKAEIAQIVGSVPDIRLLSNELVVGKGIGIGTSSADIFITSDVKLRFVNNGTFHADQLKVVAENGTVFLMGQIHRKD